MLLEKYANIAADSFKGYFYYLQNEITNPGETNYFYWLIGLSLFVWSLEIIIPWRKRQKVFRKGFWLDSFYIFFNFFLFSLIGYNALSNVGVALFHDFLELVGIENLVAVQVQHLPIWTQLLIMFLIADLIQWNVHRQLHKRSWLWEFHKVHHSVQEMGFAAQFRFHFIETIIYKTAQYFPLAMIGFGIEEFFVVHMFAVLIGHINHANLNWDYGKIGYILNNPRMHIWHHSKEFPTSYPSGVNFGLSLSLWDYLFKTAYVPKDGGNPDLGFEGVEGFPQRFSGQILSPFKQNKILVKEKIKRRTYESKAVQ